VAYSHDLSHGVPLMLREEIFLQLIRDQWGPYEGG
jgi:hypothetical protein